MRALSICDKPNKKADISFLAVDGSNLRFQNSTLYKMKPYVSPFGELQGVYANITCNSGYAV